MAATVQQIETAILTKLRAAIPALSIEPYPENPAEYELLHPLGAVLVQYDGSTYGPNQTVNAAVVQRSTLRFAVVLVMRNLRDQGGCYDMLAAIRAALSGLVIPGTLTALTCLSESFSTEADGVWIYAQTYEVAVRHVVACHT